VRAFSLRWSNTHVLAFHGLISDSMKASISASNSRKVVGEGEIHVISFDQNPYSVFFQILDSVAMASSSLISTPRPEVPRRRWWNSRTAVRRPPRCAPGGARRQSLLLGLAHRCGDDVHPEPPELVLHGGESRLGRRQLRDRIMMPMFCLNMFQ